MAFIADLSAETYCPWAHEGVASFSVGWLGDSVPQNGAVPAEVMSLLRYFARHYEYQDSFLGHHTCEICGRGSFHGEFWVELSDTISGHQVRFVLPLAVFHYIEEHEYCPPQEFLDAVAPLARRYAAKTSLSDQTMSYDISLYRKDFLKRAIEDELGDWTGADPIPEEILRSVVLASEREGFVREPIDPGFSEFLQQEGVAPGKEFAIDNATCLAQLALFPGEIAFSIPYGARADASIDLCVQLAKRLAAAHSLGFYDPQAGNAFFG